MKKILSIAICMAAMIACSKEGKESPATTTSADYPVFTACTTPTKTELSGLNINWSAGDEISIFNGDDGGSGYGNARYRAGSINGDKAAFTFNPTDASDLTSAGTVAEYAAIYPYQGVGTNSYDPGSKIISTSLPASQSYVDGSFSNGAFPMVALSGTDILNFSGVCGVLRLRLKGGAVISSIKVEADRIAGAGTIDMSASNPVLTMSSSATGVINYSCGSGVALDASTAKSFDIVLPAAVYTSIAITITDTDGGSQSFNASGLEIKRNTITPSTLDYIKNLSAPGYANCYVVTAAGGYKFSCVMPDAAHTAVTGSSANWVWATSGAWANASDADAGAMVEDITYNSVKNEIKFNVPEGFTYGNVLIALLDADNKIAYGWHIWLTSPISTVTLNGVEVMDRNLGAGGALDVTDTDENVVNNTVGLNYQWGRKDAHPGPLGYLSAAETTAFTAGSTAYSVVNTAIGNVVNWTYSGYTGDAGFTKLVDAGRHPCNVIPDSSQEDIYPAYSLNEWPAEANPCPYGYSVPTAAQISSVFDPTTTASLVKSETNSKVVGTKIGELIFPVSGYRNTGKAQGVADGRYWLADHTSVNAKHGIYCIIGPTSGATNRMKSSTANEIHSAFVRCVKN